MEANKGPQEVYSKKVKAGKRTYFFDVKSTRANDYYLTITESKKQYEDNGHRYEKHKIFLYKEDLNKFLDALHSTAEYIKKELLPHYDFDKFSRAGYDETTSSTEENGEVTQESA